MELISIIINLYNGEKSIKYCLDSIINQTYKNLEIIIINDGSTDKSLEIIKKYKDRRIRIINQKNKGLSQSRMIGVKNSKGRYVYYIDQDDYIKKDTIEFLYNNIKKYDADISTCGVQVVSNYSEKINNNKKEKIKIYSTKKILKMILIGKYNQNTLWNKLYKKELFDNIQFEKSTIDDVGNLYKIILISKKMVLSNQKKYYYYKSNSSMSRSGNTLFLKDIYIETIKRYNILSNNYKMYELKLSVLLMILMLYDSKNIEIRKLFEEQDIIKKYKKFYSIRLFFYKIPLKKKIKISVLCVSNKIYDFIMAYSLKKDFN